MQRWKGQSDDCLEEKPRHLYIVLDDWSGGYSIRKIDLFGDTNLGYSLPSASSKFGGPSSKFGLLSSTDAPEDVEASFKALPPAFFKFEAPRRNPLYFSGAFGSKILAMQPMDPQFNFNSTAGVPVYDVHMRGLMIGPRQRLDPVDPIYIPVDGRLFALAAGSFEMLYPPPCTRSAWEDFVWMWHALPDPPFQREHVTSYAVHSDLRTIFVSTKGEGCVPATFSFDTRNACIWKQQGQWQMPFHGRAYFVPELNAWVGLSGKPSSSCRICSMGLISDKCEVTYHDDLVKFSKEELFGSPPTLFGATLVSLGGSKFCIVEYDAILGPDPGFTLKRLLRLTTFSLRYDKKGDLTTGNSIQCLEYMVPDLASVNMLQIPVAFWM